jgi:hypothetical protein
MLVRGERSVYADFKSKNEIASSVHGTVKRNFSKGVICGYQVDYLPVCKNISTFLYIGAANLSSRQHFQTEGYEGEACHIDRVIIGRRFIPVVRIQSNTTTCLLFSIS